MIHKVARKYNLAQGINRNTAISLGLRKRLYYQRYAEDFLKTSVNIPVLKNDDLSVDVLICGGGILGASIAMHLAQRGGLKVMLMEQGRIGGGGTWLSNGLISAHQSWQEQVRPLAEYSNQLYRQLNEKYSEIDYKSIGRLFLAKSDFSLVDIQRMHALANAYGNRSTLMKVSDIKAYTDIVNTSDLKAGLLVPDDARVNTLALCLAMIKEAENAGAVIVENCEVSKLKINDDGLVYGVETDCGFVECKNFVNTAGLWSTNLSIESNTGIKIRIPSQACYFSYLSTGNFDGAKSDMPIIHDLDSNIYIYSHDPSTIISGGFDMNAAKSLTLTGSLPRDLNYQQLPEEWDLFLTVIEKLAHRFPCIQKAKINELVTTAENFTPDGYILVGQAPRVSNYFIATGMNCYGVTLAGGVGKLISNWLLDGYPSQDVSKIDVARFLTAHSNRQYLRTRTPEVVGLSYTLLGHTNQYGTARFLRASPINQNLRQAGAVFGEIMGYERPLYFSVDKAYPPPAFGEDFPFGKPIWYNYVSSEYQSCRERVAIMDMSNFSKFIISGPQDEAVGFLQRVCSADIDKPVGTSIFTGMQHERGGYVTDCTVNRMTQNEFFIVAPTVQQTRVKMWLHEHLKKRSGVVIQDVTSMYTALNVVGPLSRHLMQDLTDSKMSASEFPAFWCREINVGCASGIKAVSITHCGELGWVLYVPNEFALHVYQQIVETGKSYGLQHAGYYTLRQLRIEKFYVYWGMDVDWTTTPTQCGRMFRVNFNKQFIGRQALIQEKKTGVKRRYVQLLLDDHNLHQDPWPQGGEPIYRNGKFCGLTTTAAYGFTLNCQVCLGYVLNYENPEAYITDDYVVDPSVKYYVDICGKRFPAEACLHSPNLPMTSSEQPTHFRPTQ